MGKYSFTKEDRILKRSGYLHLKRFGSRIHDNFFLALVLPNSLERSRMGITVSKKVGKAATRNKIKRFSREFYRINREQLNGCWDLNIIAKPQAAKLNATQAFDSLKRLFHRINGRIVH